MIFTDLTEAEQLLWDAFPRGAWVDLGRVTAPAEDLGQAIGLDRSRVVRAEVIGALLLGAVEAEAGWAAALRLRGAVVTGRLDLMGASIAWPMICERCLMSTQPGRRFPGASPAAFVSAVRSHRSPR